MEFMKSTRSIIAVLAITLVFVVVIGTIFGAIFPNEVLMLVGTIVGSVTTAYFGKRDTIEDRLGDKTEVQQETTIKTNTKGKG
jgi:xanthine/uracil permease